jgi:hypothetical protein
MPCLHPPSSRMGARKPFTSVIVSIRSKLWSYSRWSLLDPLESDPNSLIWKGSFFPLPNGVALFHLFGNHCVLKHQLIPDQLKGIESLSRSS